jgi:DNA-directed RNA polymerase subunit omega
LVSNRFELLLLAAHRAQSLANGAQITDAENDKSVVIVPDDPSTDTVIDMMTEEHLPRGMQRLTPEEILR